MSDTIRPEDINQIPALVTPDDMHNTVNIPTDEANEQETPDISTTSTSQKAKSKGKHAKQSSTRSGRSTASKKRPICCWLIVALVVLGLGAAIAIYIAMFKSEVVITSNDTKIPMYTTHVLVRSEKSNSRDLTDLQLEDYPWISSVVADYNAFRYINSVVLRSKIFATRFINTIFLNNEMT